MKCARSAVISPAALLLLCLGGTGTVVPVHAQDYPTRPIRVVLQTGPGTGIDTVTRLLAAEMSKALAGSVVAENMPGAAGIVAHRYVAKQAAPDGYTLLGAVTTSMTLPVFYKELGFDLQRDLAPVALAVEGPLVLMTNQAAPWNSLNEMLAFAKANPGKLNFGNPGPGDATILYMEAIRQRYGVQVVDVAYKGSSTAFLQALATSEVHLAIAGERAMIPLYRNKSIKPLAVSGSVRLASLPEVPTFEELGLPGIDGVGMMYLTVAGTPRPIIDRLNAAILQALRTPGVKEALTKIGYSVVGSSPEALASRIAAQSTRYLELGRKAGITPQ